VKYPLGRNCGEIPKWLIRWEEEGISDLRMTFHIREIQEEASILRPDSGEASFHQDFAEPATFVIVSGWVTIRSARGRDIQRQRRELDARQRSIESEASAR
jgi:hypothetical protein